MVKTFYRGVSSVGRFATHPDGESGSGAGSVDSTTDGEDSTGVAAGVGDDVDATA
jgi:hypothetical protein